VTCHPRGKNYGHRTPPGPCVPHGGTPEAPQCPLTPQGGTLSEQGSGIVVVVVVVSCPSACGACTKLPQPRGPPVPAYNVAAGHSRWSLRVSDAGGSRRSYRNGRASAVAEGTPFPKGPPKSSVGGTPGWNLSSSARRYGWPPPGLYLSVRRDLPTCPVRSQLRPVVVSRPSLAKTFFLQRQLPCTVQTAPASSLLLLARADVQRRLFPHRDSLPCTLLLRHFVSFCA
jgi:hypothetical protein